VSIKAVRTDRQPAVPHQRLCRLP